MMPQSMGLLSEFVYLVAVSVAVAWAWSLLWRRFYEDDRRADAVYFVTTADGWRLALHRYRAAKPMAGALPALLCPGLACSGAIFEASGGSLARYLSRRGIDTWIIDLRGRGLSSRPRFWGKFRRDWGLDDYVSFDIPCALDEVCRRADVPAVNWLGFGFGATAIWQLLATQPAVAERVASCVSLAAHVEAVALRSAATPGLTRLFRWLGPRRLVSLVAPLLGRYNGWPTRLFYHSPNVDPRVLRSALVNSTEDMSARELRQVERWLDNASLGEDAAGPDASALAKLTTPHLLLAGPRDPLAPVGCVQRAFEAWGATKKQVVIAGRHVQLTANYGHLDLLIGKNAQVDVFPRLLAWIAKQGAEQPDALNGLAEDRASHAAVSGNAGQRDDNDPDTD